MSLSLPPYADLPGSRTFQPPYLFTGTTAQFFVLRANMERLRKVTDAWLNSVPGSPFVYKPLLPFVACTPMAIDSISCTNPPDSQMGWMRESDFNFSYFVEATKDGRFDHVACVFPYLIVDTPLTMATGREVFGFRKAFGNIEYAPGGYQPVAASTWLFKKFGTDQQIEVAEVARIVPPSPNPKHNPVATLKHLLELIKIAAEDLLLDAAVAVERLISHLKQPAPILAYMMPVRDVEQPMSSGYAVLIEGPMTITKLHRASMLPDGYTIQLTDYASYPLISDLGIKVNGQGVAKSLMSYEVSFDCTLELGKVLAVAGRTTASGS
jgi:hypothetical protein